MKIVRYFYLLALCPTALCAQIPLAGPDSLVVSTCDTSVTTIVDKINQPEPGKGTVRIIQDKLISERIGRPDPSNEGTFQSRNDKYVEISGWRIQVFAGNNQRLSKNEAFRKEADIKSTFPEMTTYVTYTAPFWRLRVGDCQTFKDASDLMAQLRRAFPGYGREMSIVKETILIKED